MRTKNATNASFQDLTFAAPVGDLELTFDLDQSIQARGTSGTVFSRCRFEGGSGLVMLVSRRISDLRRW